MSVSVLIPWRSGCPHREAALEWVRARYAQRHPDWPVIVGEHTEGEWCKAAAVADALRQTDADVLIVADGDCWSDALAPAVACIEAGAPWVCPRNVTRRLSEAATAGVLAGADPNMSMALDRRPYSGIDAGGLVVLSREAYETAPLDPRFRGYGKEDEAWSRALKVLVGKCLRLDAWPLWHLYHPPQDKRLSDATKALDKRYKTSTRPRMAAVVEEGRQACLLTL